MRGTQLVKEVKKRSGSLGYPVACLLETAKISKTCFRAWDSGYQNPSPTNIAKLKDVLSILDHIEEVNNRRRECQQ